MSVYLLDQAKSLEDKKGKIFLPYSFCTQHGGLHWLTTTHSRPAAPERSGDFWQAQAEGKNSYHLSLLDLCLQGQPEAIGFL